MDLLYPHRVLLWAGIGMRCTMASCRNNSFQSALQTICNSLYYLVFSKFPSLCNAPAVALLHLAKLTVPHARVHKVAVHGRAWHNRARQPAF